MANETVKGYHSIRDAIPTSAIVGESHPLYAKRYLDIKVHGMLCARSELGLSGGDAEFFSPSNEGLLAKVTVDDVVKYIAPLAEMEIAPADMMFQDPAATQRERTEQKKRAEDMLRLLRAHCHYSLS